MQVSCFAFDWDELRKRPSAEAVVEEMLLTDDVDLYALYLPDELWPNDSAYLHFQVAEALAGVAGSPQGEQFPGLPAVMEIIAEGDALDEEGLSALTEGCYFISLSPQRVAALGESFAALDLERLAAACARHIEEPQELIQGYLTQWRGAAAFAAAHGKGLIGHCG